MPVNFEKYETYSINYKSLYNFLKVQPILYYKQNTKKYLKKWIKVLKFLDYKTTKKFKKDNSNFIKDANNNLKYETFLQTFTFNNNIKILINYRIDLIEDFLTKYNLLNNWNEIDIDLFKTNESIISWTLVESLTQQPIQKKPIYLAKFNDGIKKWILIDGNFRISHIINSRQKTIKAYLLTENFMLRNNIFLSKFDKYLYAFINEMQTFQELWKIKHVPDKKLIKNSFLFKNEFISQI
ncbi:hypothetical protein [Spiroplasma sp. DGKH1]|uniref:hypothetical protein n=1 Tax=Spiroplasma sp. DGKH1 TaxID=3050074 RepID=UPI0034C67B8C